jgi:isopenicillin-N N-acyltransferase-like protein
MELFPIVELTGNPRRRGEIHGRALAEAIGENLRIYLHRIGTSTGIEKERVLKLARRFVPAVKDAAPWLLEEMEGIARGAGLPLEAVLVLNARTELMYPSAISQECTTLGLSADRTVNGCTLLAQNWDWIPQLRRGVAFFRLKPEHGQTSLYFCEAGQLAKIGLNESGMGILLNILITEDVRAGIPVHVLLRLIIEQCTTLEEAAALIEGAYRASSSHVLLGDTRGGILGVEFSPKGTARITPNRGLVIHTNHFCDSQLSVKDSGLSLIPDSSRRLERAWHLLSERNRLSIRDLKCILSDHKDGPSSICRHIDPLQPLHQQMETVASLILDLNKGTISATFGQPCKNPYHELRL